jgi:hypothetical protein
MSASLSDLRSSQPDAEQTRLLAKVERTIWTIFLSLFLLGTLLLATLFLLFPSPTLGLDDFGLMTFAWAMLTGICGWTVGLIAGTLVNWKFQAPYERLGSILGIGRGLPLFPLQIGLPRLFAQLGLPQPWLLALFLLLLLGIGFFGPGWTRKRRDILTGIVLGMIVTLILALVAPRPCPPLPNTTLTTNTQAAVTRACTSR